jgi:putative exporter of polyketide antibiotics
MMSGIIDVWEKFAFLQQFSASGFGETVEQQYLAMVYEVLPPFLAGFVITQSGKWTLDLTQGRLPLFLSTPISMTRLIFNRFIATLIGSELIIISALATIWIGSTLQGVETYTSGIWRVFVMTNLFAISFTAINALLVAILHGKSATQAISIYVGAAWMIVFMAPYLNWPSWTVRLSIFEAFGHPFIKWPPGSNFAIIALAITLGTLGALVISNRSAKTL